MAQAKRSSSKKRSSSSNRTSSKSSRSKKNSSSSNSSLAEYLSIFRESRFFVPVITVLVIAGIILLDLLFAWNNYDTFFKILGFELLITSVIYVFILAIGTQDINGDQRD